MEPHPPEENENESADSDLTIADRLVLIGLLAELFHTVDGEAYATATVNNHAETWHLRSRQFSRWLGQQYFEQEGRSPRTTALSEALGTLEGHALYKGPERRVETRIARANGRVYLDLANEAWEVVEIGPEGWQLTDNCPVRFRRSAGMRTLPKPERGGQIGTLLDFLNVSNLDSRVLIVAWCVNALLPDEPHPPLVFYGEQGSAKSTASRLVRQAIDPNKADLRAEPQSTRDLMIWAVNAHIIALDNLSGLKPWLSDSLCRLSTGGGFSTRQLYSDSDEIHFDAIRPCILNGIGVVANRPDLLDRSVLIQLPKIPANERREESALWKEFREAHGCILGALLDLVSATLRELPGVRLTTLPRMADFARMGVAVERALDWATGTFIAAYEGNREEAVSAAVEASPIGPVLMEFVKKQHEWTGTFTDLLRELTAEAGEERRSDRAWPKNPHALSWIVRRLAGNLHVLGIGFEDLPRTSVERKVRLWVETANGPSSPSSPSPQSLSDIPFGYFDGKGDTRDAGDGHSGRSPPRDTPVVQQEEASEVAKLVQQHFPNAKECRDPRFRLGGELEAEL